jgi:predicted secreted acid phosphatase
VLIDPETLISGPRRLACAAQPLAVAINLDPGTGKLDLDDPPAAAPGLAEALSAIRAAGVRVFWTSALPVDKADRVYAILRATGLDLDGTDRLLLARKASETVQQRRQAAARDWCFVALAGDRPGDFEEALDFLRDPDGPTARAMQPLAGSGWFIIPDPIA